MHFEGILYKEPQKLNQALTKGQFAKGGLQQSLARTFGGSYSCPHPSPWPPFFPLS